MVSRDLCPLRRNTVGTHGYPYYFHRGTVLTSRPTLVRRLLLFPWLVFRKYPPGAGRSPFTQRYIHSCGCRCRYRACGCNVTERAQEGSSALSPHAHLERYPDYGAPRIHFVVIFHSALRDVFEAPWCFRSTPHSHALGSSQGNRHDARTRQAHRYRSACL